LPWQLEQTPEASWEECQHHAERLEALLGRSLTEGSGNDPSQQGGLGRPIDLFGKPLATDLFGKVIPNRTGTARRSR
jgi:hypothetical protein